MIFCLGFLTVTVQVVSVSFPFSSEISMYIKCKDRTAGDRWFRSFRLLSASDLLRFARRRLFSGALRSRSGPFLSFLPRFFLSGSRCRIRVAYRGSNFSLSTTVFSYVRATPTGSIGIAQHALMRRSLSARRFLHFLITSSRSFPIPTGLRIFLVAVLLKACCCARRYAI